MNRKLILLAPVLSLAAALFAAQDANASMITVSASSGMRSASAVFDDSTSGILKVTLTNTSMSDAMEPIDLLTAVFFDLGGSPALSPVSAILASGSVVWFDTVAPTPVMGDVSGEWAYKYDSMHLTGVTQKYGISSSGLGIFGTSDLFGTTDLADPADPDGPNYGITTAGDIMTTGNPEVTGGPPGNPDKQVPLIKNSVVFTFDVATTFSLSTVSNVRFQYGTALTEPYITPPGGPTSNEIAPEPSSVIMLGMGACSVLGFGWRRRKPEVAA